MIQKVDEQTFNVRTVVILVCHDHQVTISQAIGGSVVDIALEPEDLLNVLNLGVFHDGLVTRISHIEELSTKREYTIVVASHDTKTRHGERFRRVTFGKDQRASLRVSAARIVGVFELDNTGNTVVSARQEGK